jgi:hypothetical protein
VNTSQPTTVEQSYINAENFLQMQGAKIVVEAVKDFDQHLTKDEKVFIESMIKLMR